MHGLTFFKEDGKMFNFIIFPSQQIVKAYLETLMEDFKAIGYDVSFEEKDGKYVLNIASKIIITGA